MSTLLLIAACTGPSKPAGETAESAETADSVIDSETAQETAETDTGESADSADTVDTAPYTEWNPGDDIPGWEDADCTEQHPGRTYVIEYQDIFLIDGSFLAGMPGVGPHTVHVRLRDCEDFPCAADSLDLTVPYILADLDATRGDDGHPRGTGEWGPDATTNRQAVGSGLSMLMDWATDGSLDGLASLTVCVERMRPDEVRGAVRAEVAAARYPYGVINYYDSLVYRFPFAVQLPDHAGFDASQPDSPADKPEGYDTAHFVYEQPFDEAWPWDDITDPSIREQIQDRYTPYNGI